MTTAPPRGGPLAASTEPSWASTTAATMASPSPVPSVPDPPAAACPVGAPEPVERRRRQVVGEAGPVVGHLDPGAVGAPGPVTVHQHPAAGEGAGVGHEVAEHLLEALAVGVDEHVVAGHRGDRPLGAERGPRRPRPGAAGSRRGAAAAARPGRGGPARGGPRPAPSAAPPPARRRPRTGGPPRCRPVPPPASASCASSTSPRTTVSGVRSSWLASSRNWRSVAIADSTAAEQRVEAGGQGRHLVVAGRHRQPAAEPAHRQAGRLVGQLA